MLEAASWCATTTFTLVVFAIHMSDTLHALEPCIAYRYEVADVGFWAGLISSGRFAGNLLTSWGWGYVADRIGRRSAKCSAHDSTPLVATDINTCSLFTAIVRR